jgi:oligopeptidase B
MAKMNPPRLEKKPQILIKHGHKREDPYYWIADRENPAVIKHLNAENKYTKEILAPTKSLQRSLFDEMKARMKENDTSPPVFKNGYWYYSKVKAGKGQSLFYRKKESLSAKEELLIDENKEAKKHGFYELVGFEISKNNQFMAFAEDIEGSGVCQIRFKNLVTNKVLPFVLLDVEDDFAWHGNNEDFYFSELEQETLRTNVVKKINLLTFEQETIFQENDPAFSVSVQLSQDGNWIFIGTYSTLTNHYLYKSAETDEPFKPFWKREKGHEYFPEADGNEFFIKTNLNAKNYQLVRCPIDQRSPEHWITIQENDSRILIEDFEVFEHHVVVQEKINGLSQLRVYDRVNYKSTVIPPFEETYTLYLADQNDGENDNIRIGYSSMTTPESIFEINLRNFEKTLVKQAEVQGEFDPNAYHSERVFAKAQDGVEIPISLVYKKSLFEKNGTNPALILGYGAYGEAIDPYFSAARLSLLNRGFLFVIVHVRGGDDLGTEWYEQGKLANKMNTFTDFIAATEYLILQKYIHPKHAFAVGGSAGGLLVAAVANLRPDLFRGIIAQVPFVDVVTTMLDHTLPLTSGEYDEWGNPKRKKDYHYLHSYSPYDQLKAQAYPHFFVSAGLHDQQVQFWEPTKFVAKLRDLNLSGSVIILKTNLKAGHGGAANRYQQLSEAAEEYAFILYFNEIESTNH